MWRHGWNATAVQSMDPGYAYFTRGDGCVAYVESRGKARVAAGAPIASDARLGEVGEAFVDASRDAGRRCCFFATERRFAQEVDGKLESMTVGEQPVWDPSRWDEKLRRSPSLRENVRRARAKDVHVRHLGTDQERRQMLPVMRNLKARWLGTKGLAPMEFLVRVSRSRPTAHAV